MQRRLTLVGALVLALAARGVPAASEPPISIDAARRLSVEDPRGYLEQSLAWLASAAAVGDADWRREILLRRGRAAWMVSDRTVASEAAAQLDALADSEQMPVARAYALLLRADESADFGLYESAIKSVVQAARILRSTKDPHWRAIANAELCDVYWGSSQQEQAMPRCQKAAEYFRSVGDEWHLARTENAIAMLLDDDGHAAQAIATANAARERFSRLNMPSMVAMIDDNLSSIYLDAGDAAKALEVSERSLKVELEAGKDNYAMASRSNIAMALSALGRHDEALASIDKAIADASQQGMNSRIESLYINKMLIAESAGKLPLALQAARSSMEATAQLSNEQTRRAIAELESRNRAVEQRYELERMGQQQQIRELELARAREENSRQSAQLARQDLWLWLVTVTTSAMFLVSLLLFALWRSSRRHAARMRILADTDGLTGVLNRRAFVERLQACFSHRREEGGSACLCIVDADYFKRINDTRGHQVGDLALKRIARALGAGLLGDEVVGRMGGEEFALLLPGADAETGMQRAEQLRAGIAVDHEQADGLGFPMTVSIGVAALASAPMRDCEAWLVGADQALYRAKELGRNRCEAARVDVAVDACPDGDIFVARGQAPG